MKNKTIDGASVMVEPLPGLDAIDLGNEIIANLAPGVAAGVIGHKAFGAMAAIEAIGMSSNALTGKLSNLLPRLLATTTVVIGKTKFDLSKGTAEIDRLLAERPTIIGGLVAFVGEVQFARFFPESAITALRTRMQSLSADFSQSMSGTGSSGA